MTPTTDGQSERGDAGPILCRVFDCSSELGAQILLRGRLRDFGVRATVIRRGDRVSALHIVIRGLAHAVLYSLDGQMVLLHEYRSGDLFGVVSPPYTATHDADVVSIEELALFLLEGSALALLAEQHRCISSALLRIMVDRLQQTAARMYEHIAVSATGRVHAELLRQARLSPDLAIRPIPVLAELALRVSTTRETASRAVSALERRGIVRRSDEALIVVAPHRLEELIV